MKNSLLLLLFCLGSFFTAYGQSNGSLSGIIQDDNGEPVVGATVVLLGTNYATITNTTGRYQLNNVTAGNYTLEVRFVGYERAQTTVTVTAGQNTEASPKLQESAVVLSGLVVTAQKREQVTQDVPVAISSVDASFLRNNGIFEINDFSEYVPGLQVQVQSVNNPGFVIRGITSDNGASNIEPRVSVFQDGVSISKSRGSVVEMFDFERVEVLKGPQGTLFGRGAQIGAVHLIQNKAKNETSGELTIGYGNLNQQLANGYLNLPLAKDKLFLRVAGIYNYRDGFIENLSGGNLNGKNTAAGRLAMRWLPGRNTVVDFIFNYQKDNPPGTSFKSGTFAPAGGDLNPRSFADMERGRDLFIDRVVWGNTLLVNHTFSDRLDLTSTTAYREFASVESFDADGTAAPALWFAEEAEGRQFSQEFRFNYRNNKWFSGFAGTSFFWEDGSQGVPFETNEQSLYPLLTPVIRNTIQTLPGLSPEQRAGLLFLTPAVPLVDNNGRPNLVSNIPVNPFFAQAGIAGAPLRTLHREKNTNFGTNYAFEVFADGTFNISPKLDLTLGLRGTYENITSGYQVETSQTPSPLGVLTGNFPNILFRPTGNQRLEANREFWSMVGRAAVVYKATDNINIFASAARGRRPNVVQFRNNEPEVLNAEVVWSYELGAKTLWLNNRLQVDVNGFYYDYSNFQTQIAELTNEGLRFFPRDGGEASAIGGEANFQYAISRNFSVFSNYAYIDAKFDDTDKDGNRQELAGNRFRLTPEHSVSLGFNWTVPITDDFTYFLTPNYTYKSKVFFEEENQPGVEQDGYGLLNVRTGFRWKNKYQATFYMYNVLDENYVIDAGNTGGAFGIPTFIAGLPRWFGVQLNARF
jgi:outer membrane receptor protein involved in Fe transport